MRNKFNRCCCDVFPANVEFLGYLHARRIPYTADYWKTLRIFGQPIGYSAIVPFEFQPPTASDFDNGAHAIGVVIRVDARVESLKLKLQRRVVDVQDLSNPISEERVSFEPLNDYKIQGLHHPFTEGSIIPPVSFGLEPEDNHITETSVTWEQAGVSWHLSDVIETPDISPIINEVVEGEDFVPFRGIPITFLPTGSIAPTRTIQTFSGPKQVWAEVARAFSLVEMLVNTDL